MRGRWFTFSLRHCSEKLPSPAAETARQQLRPHTQQQRASSACPVTACLGDQRGNAGLGFEPYRSRKCQYRTLSSWVNTSEAQLSYVQDGNHNSNLQMPFTEHLLYSRLELPAVNQPDKSQPGAYVLVVSTCGPAHGEKKGGKSREQRPPLAHRDDFLLLERLKHHLICPSDKFGLLSI